MASEATKTEVGPAFLDLGTLRVAEFVTANSEDRPILCSGDEFWPAVASVTMRKNREHRRPANMSLSRKRAEEQRDSLAMLFAAAPDLLAACKAALDAAELVEKFRDDEATTDKASSSVCDTDSLIRLADAADSLRAALTKATGGAA